METRAYNIAIWCFVAAVLVFGTGCGIPSDPDDGHLYDTANYDDSELPDITWELGTEYRWGYSDKFDTTLTDLYVRSLNPDTYPDGTVSSHQEFIVLMNFSFANSTGFPQRFTEYQPGHRNSALLGRSVSAGPGVEFFRSMEPFRCPDELSVVDRSEFYGVTVYPGDTVQVTSCWFGDIEESDISESDYLVLHNSRSLVSRIFIPGLVQIWFDLNGFDGVP